MSYSPKFTTIHKHMRKPARTNVLSVESRAGTARPFPAYKAWKRTAYLKFKVKSTRSSFTMKKNSVVA